MSYFIITIIGNTLVLIAVCLLLYVCHMQQKEIKQLRKALSRTEKRHVVLKNYD